MPVLARRRYEIGEPVEELKRREFDDAMSSRPLGLPSTIAPDKYRIFRNGRVARVTGEIEAYQTGWHAFSADNYPPKTQYKIADVELGRYSYNEVFMEAGKRYPVEILYDAERTHPSTNQGIRLKWATPRGTWPGAFTPIPVSQLHAP